MERLAGITPLALATALVAISVPGTAWAQDKSAAAKVRSSYKVLVDNARAIAGESARAPGAASASVIRPPRVVRALQGGTLTVVHADGRTERSVFETDAAHFFEADSAEYLLRNDGSTEIKLQHVLRKPRQERLDGGQLDASGAHARAVQVGLRALQIKASRPRAARQACRRGRR